MSEMVPVSGPLNRQLPSGWRWATVGDTGRYINGVAFKPADWGAEGLPIVRIQNLTNAAKPLNRTTRKVDPIYRIEFGDLLVSWSATLDAFIWDREPGLVNQHIFKVLPDERIIEKRFLFYLLRLAISEMMKSEHLHGSTMKHINRGPFLAHRVALPPLSEQRRLVAEMEKQLTRVEAGVAALRRIQANLKRYRAGVLKAACEGRLVPTEAELARQAGRAGDFESGSALLGRILEERRRGWKGKGKYKEPAEPDTTDLPELPEGWAWASVAQLLRESPCNGLSVKGSDSPPGVRALRLGAMSDVGFDYEQVRYLPLKRSDVEDLLVADGDFFISRGNGTLALVGRGTLAQAAPRETIFPDTMIRLRLSLVVLGTNWIPRIWASPFIRTQVEARVKTTAGIYKISQPEAANIVVPVPPLAEQIRIVAEMEHRLSVVAELEAAVEANLRRGASLRQAILQRAFSGAGQTPHD